MTIHQCPACNAKDTLRTSGTRRWEWPLRLIGLRAFRCQACYERFHGRWHIPVKASEAHAEISPTAPQIKSASIEIPAIESLPLLKAYAPESGSQFSDPLAFVRPEELSNEEKPSRPRSRRLSTMRFTLLSFAVLLLLHFLIGALEFQPLGKAAMWVNLLSLVTLVGALLAFIDLYRARRSSAAAVGATVGLVLRWESLFLATELVVGLIIGPGGHGLSSDIALFREQSPWIWMTYAVLPVSGVIGCSAYLLFEKDSMYGF